MASAETVVEEDFPLKMASLKDARAVIEKGKCANWGQLPDFTQKTDKFGLGFTAEAQRAVRKERIRKAPVFITNPRVNAIKEEVQNQLDANFLKVINYPPWIANIVHVPKKALDRLDCEGLELKPSNIIVRAFDGSKRMVHGEVDIPIRVDSQVFNSTFYVMDIRPSYSCLLGRPWIHKAGAVTSTLHQKLK